MQTTDKAKQTGQTKQDLFYVNKCYFIFCIISKFMQQLNLPSILPPNRRHEINQVKAKLFRSVNVSPDHNTNINYYIWI